MKHVIRFAVYAVLASALVSGCSKGGPRGVLPGGQTASTFPLYAPSTVVTAGKYDDSTEVTTLGSSFFGTGADQAYPYAGVQELIKTSASLDDLDAWVRKLVQSPPPDLYPSQNTIDRETSGASPAPDQSPSAAPADSAAPSASASASADPSASPPAGASASPSTSAVPSPLASGEAVVEPFADSFKVFGLVPSSFWSKDRGHVVMLIILDPKQVAGHLGSTLDMLDQYEKMPDVLRSGIDAAIKKQVGFSVSDLLDTNTPMGMIVYAARNWKNEDTRAIILVDAVRQPNPLPTPHNT